MKDKRAAYGHANNIIFNRLEFVIDGKTRYFEQKRESYQPTLYKKSSVYSIKNKQSHAKTKNTPLIYNKVYYSTRCTPALFIIEREHFMVPASSSIVNLYPGACERINERLSPNVLISK